jgi:peptidoglycan/xylan/chitin deacetylase (PgdA/CDA1 family)
MGRKQSVTIANEILCELGNLESIKHINFPSKGRLEQHTLNFLEHNITKVILKRRETSSFPIKSRFSDEPLKGEPICELEDGTTIIARDDHTLNFGFDPFVVHLINLNEGFQYNDHDVLMQKGLVMYWYLPCGLRRGVRWLARRYYAREMRSLSDLDLLGVSSNVLIQLIESHLLESGLIKDHQELHMAVTTHDIDTDFCQKEGREIVASVEHNLGIKASYFFVPRSVQYDLNKHAIRSLIDDGHEIGMHGVSHDGKLALHDSVKLTQQIRAGKKILESTGAKVVSFRSPWILRSSLLPETLASEGFKVDSSFPDVDTISMSRQRKGLSYNRPFRPRILKGNSLQDSLPIWEVPVSGPQDVHLIEDLKVTDEQLLQVWKYKADFCRDFNGVFVLHTHPLHIFKRIETYAQFLRYLQKQGFQISTLETLSEIWNSKHGFEERNPV